MKKRPNATPSGPAGHSRQAFQGGTYSLMLTAAVLALLIVLNLLVSALPTNLTQYDISASKLYSVTSNTKVVVNALEQDVTIYWIVQSGEEDAVKTSWANTRACPTTLPWSRKTPTSTPPSPSSTPTRR